MKQRSKAKKCKTKLGACFYIAIYLANNHISINTICGANLIHYGFTVCGENVLFKKVGGSSLQYLYKKANQVEWLLI